MPTPTVSPVVHPSGQGITFFFADPSVVPPKSSYSPVTHVVDNNAVQSVVVNDAPSGYSSPLPFTLTFNGQTTGTINATPNPAANYWQWNITGLPPGTYDIAADIPYSTSNAVTSATYEAFDGTTYLGSATLNQRTTGGNAGSYLDPSSPPLTMTGNGTTVKWFPCGGPYTVNSGTLRVRLTGPADGNYLVADDIRVSPTGAVGTTTARAKPDGTCTSATGGHYSGPGPYAPTGTISGDTASPQSMQGSGQGPRYLLDPAAVKAALESLSGIGAGSLTVTGAGDADAPMSVTFAGPLANLAQPLMTSSLGSSHIAIATTAIGGALPVITINGGTPIHLARSWVYYRPTRPNNQDPNFAAVMFFFPQDPPAVTYSPAGHHDNTIDFNGGGYWTNLYNGWDNQASASTDARHTATYYFRPVTAGTYRVSATWVPAAGQSTAATFTVKSYLTGNVLATYTANQSVAPSGDTAKGLTWQVLGSVTLAKDNDGLVVVQSNGSTGPIVADAMRFERTSADKSLRIAPTDVLTYSALDGWATCLAGPAAAVTGAPVANKSGGHMYPDLPTTATMPIGYNVGYIADVAANVPHANLFLLQGGFRSTDPATGVNTTVYPTQTVGNGFYRVSNSQITYGADRKNGMPIAPGDYVLVWDGTSNLTPDGTAGTITEIGTAVYPSPTGLNNQRPFHATGDAFHYGPELGFRVRGTHQIGDTGSPNYTPIYSADFRNVRIYPAGTDLNNPPKYLPSYLNWLSGATCFRSMDANGVIFNNPVEFLDYNPPQDRFTRTSPTRTLNPKIVDIRQYTGTDPRYTFSGSQGVAIQFTTDVPHQFPLMFQLTIHDYPESVGGVDQIPILSDGTDTTYRFKLDGVRQAVYPISANVFVMYIGPKPRDGSTTKYQMTNVITNPVGSIATDIGTGFPLQDQVEICNLASLDYWLNTTYCTSDDALTKLGQYLAAHLNPGKKLYVELSDETWNNTFPTYHMAWNGGTVLYGANDGDETPLTCELSFHHWNLISAAWVAGGRSAFDFVRVMGTLHVYPAITQKRASYCYNRSPRIQFDVIAGGPYFENATANNPPPETGFADAIDLMTVDQHLDAFEAQYTAGQYETEVPNHLNVLKSYGESAPGARDGAFFAGVKYVGYEGGPGFSMLDNGRGPRPNIGPKSNGIWRHPRIYGIDQHIFRVYQDSGLALLNIYGLAGAAQPNFNDWSHFLAMGELPYAPGNAAQDAIQVDQFDRIDLIQATTPGAVKAWAAIRNAVPDFTLAASPATVSVALGGGSTATSTVTLTALNGYAGTATLTTSPLPAGVTATLGTTTLTGGGASAATWTFSASDPATAGTYAITVTARDAANNLVHTATATLTVTAPATPPVGGPTLLVASIRRVRGFDRTRPG